MEINVRASYNQVGDYLYSEDLCVGVFDGTDFNSGTCERSDLTSTDSRFPTSSMIIRYNMIEPNVGYIASVMGNLTSETSAQCVMTNTTSTACWVWDNGFNECFERYHYENAAFVSSDACDRTRVVEDSYALYVRSSDNTADSTDVSQSSAAAGTTMAEKLTLRSIVIASMILAQMLLTWQI
ncbi:hypothetical protein LPJ59_004485 [Coemansia sp. RSA 2399]|nr:hypothetical protein LPJ59_004485 [Coemansia sp. RSA 2399]KAJ1907682.1 hypothetical protein LPJ81_000592 [Coemansia sp. IMI 209127]